MTQIYFCAPLYKSHFAGEKLSAPAKLQFTWGMTEGKGFSQGGIFPLFFYFFL
jgi:hypothetical protein